MKFLMVIVICIAGMECQSIFEQHEYNSKEECVNESQYVSQYMQEVFPTLGDDWGIYMPEVKYLSPEPLVNYDDLSLVDYPNIHFVGDALSARGITVSGAQGIYVAESIIAKQH